MVKWHEHGAILNAFDDYLGVPHPDSKQGRLRAYSLVKVVPGDAPPTLVTPHPVIRASDGTPFARPAHLYVGVAWLAERYPGLIPDLLEEMLS